MDLQERIQEEAARLKDELEIPATEVEEALARGIEYLENCGRPEEEAFAKATELLEMAAYYEDEEIDEDLRNTLEMMLYGVIDDIKPGCEY